MKNLPIKVRMRTSLLAFSAFVVFAAEPVTAEDKHIDVGVQGGKLVFLGKLPVNIQSQVYYNVVKPDVGPDWQLRFQVQVLLPTPGSG